MNPLIVGGMDNTTVLNLHQQSAVSTVQLTMACLSFVGASSTVLAMTWRDQITRPEIYPFFQLSLSDLLASFGMILSCILFKIPLNDITEVCRITTAFATGFYIITFALTVTFALETLRLLQMDSIDRLVSAAYVISWSVALPFFAISFLTEAWNSHKVAVSKPVCTKHNYQCLMIMHHVKDECLAEQAKEMRGREITKAYFLTILLITFLLLIVLYYIIYKRVRRKHCEGGLVRKEEHSKAKDTRNRGIIHCFAFAVCWLPSLILGCMTYSTNISVPNIYGLYIWQAICSPSQGLVNSIVYGWSRTAFHRALRLNVNLPPSRTPFARWQNNQRTVYHTFSDHEASSSEADSNANRVVAM